MAKICVIDDEPNLRLLYRSEFERMGHEVICHANGREAYRSLPVDQPDLIILDIMMPEGDGLEFLSNVLVMHVGIPVIINSAYAQFKNDFVSWAAEAYVVKSSDLSELKEQVHRVLFKFSMATA